MVGKDPTFAHFESEFGQRESYNPLRPEANGCVPVGFDKTRLSNGLCHKVVVSAGLLYFIHGDHCQLSMVIIICYSPWLIINHC